MSATSHEIASIQIPLPTFGTVKVSDSQSDNKDNNNNNNNKSKSVTKYWTWKGYSYAGIATSFVLTEPRWIFDCGCIIMNSNQQNHQQQQRPSCIFITHTHNDHIQALIQILFSHKPIRTTNEIDHKNDKNNNSNSNNVNTIHVYFPAETESLLQNFLLSYYYLIRDDTNDDDTGSIDNQQQNIINMEQYYNFLLHPVHVDDEFVIPSHTTTTASSKSKGKCNIEYIVRIVQCFHRKVCIGYSIFQRQLVLVEPYRSMSGIELGKYIKSGGIIEKEWSTLQPIICFLGDTTTQVFIKHPELLQQHKIIAIECTYYYGTIHDELNNENQHTYWDVLRTNIIQKHPNILFLLQHFSKRHRRYEWKEWMYEYNKYSQHYNVHPMIPTIVQLVMNQEDKSCNCFLCQQHNNDTKPTTTLDNE